MYFLAPKRFLPKHDNTLRILITQGTLPCASLIPRTVQHTLGVLTRTLSFLRRCRPWSARFCRQQQDFQLYGDDRESIASHDKQRTFHNERSITTNNENNVLRTYVAFTWEVLSLSERLINHSYHLQRRFVQ